MAQLATPQPSGGAADAGQQRYGLALTSLVVLFFMMGFITCLNDILVPTLKNAFSLTYLQASLVQVCFFFAYLVMSVPSGSLVEKLGYKRGMMLGFIAAGLGCLLFIPAAEYRVYGIFLFALFVLASGITLLQVAANPYVAILGSAETASSRLTLTQAFNSVGTTLAPSFGAAFILAGMIKAAPETQLSASQIAANLSAVKLPYLGIAAVLFAIAAVLFFLKLPAVKAAFAAQSGQAAKKSAWSYRHLVLGAVGIFAYVGAEVAIGSFLISYINETMQLPEEQGGAMLKYYWGGAMLGRFLGTFALRVMAPNRVLMGTAAAAILLIGLAMLSNGALSVYALLSIGFFNAIMFATIFTLAINGLGPHTNQGSGILCSAIVGGAIVPAMQGYAIDTLKEANAAIVLSFAVPAICYAYIVWYGLKGYKAK